MLLSSFWAPSLPAATWNAGRYIVLVFVGFLLHGTVKLETPEKQRSLKAFMHGFMFYTFFFLSEIYIFPIASKLYTNALYMDKQLFIKGIVNWGFSLGPSS